ncbi:hypothetical protein EJD97_025438 [Solanum chilense]|uniref:Gag-pol polyprotein n=1 Tax=Solanum chilense TaxID=4083 RepID=A0A6N2C2H1_SOLCI|nr:hypothetical protein EJD97_025438 [Solanum chilense]
MNTQRNTTQRLELEISNAGAPPCDYQSDIRDILVQMAQDITTQDQSATIQAQAMTPHANREVGPRANQEVSTMASRLRDFTQINPPILCGSKVEEDLQEFIDEVHKILLSMGLSTSEKAELSTYKIKDVDQAWKI